MRLISCLDPKSIVNPYTKERMIVACGKCAACRNRHASFWVKRLRAEQRSWRFCMFVTLTYSDNYLPTLHMDDVLDLAIDYKTGYCIPISELISNDSKSNKYMFSRLRSRLGLPYTSTDVIQKFHKRLNKYIHDNYTKKYQNFRYFFVTEYGGTTYRTHHHALYFFNDRRVAADFQKILVATWQNTDNVEVGISSEQVTGNAASYVAQYINCSSHIPAIYKNPKLKAKYFFSKSPSLGSLEPLDESISELFFRCSPTRVEYNAARNTYDNVRISFQVENRLFPRVPRFCETNSTLRVRLYQLSRGADSFNEFKQKLIGFSKSFDFASSYFSVLADSDRNLYSYLNWLTNGFKFEKTSYADVSSFNHIMNRVLRFYYVARRINVQSSQFGIGLHYYDRLITRYYDNLDSLHLKSFYEVQESYSSAHTSDDLPLMYRVPDDFNRAYRCEVVPQLRDTFAWKDLFSTANMIEAKNTKTHRKNEYLLKMRDKSLSIILNNYFNG